MNDAGNIFCLRECAGNSVQRAEILTLEPLQRFVAAIGGDPNVEKTKPRLGHWAYFSPRDETASLSADGTAKRDGLFTPINGRRRMLAGAKIDFVSDLELGQPATKVSTVVAIDQRSSSRGNLVFVEIQDTVVQGSEVRVREKRTLAFVSDAASIPTIEIRNLPIQGGDQVWIPSSVDLFRFSAATFNGHRIHYDLPYAMNTEGYPGLVVQGPLTAAHLLAYAERRSRRIVSFAFRATAPLFAGHSVVLRKISNGEFQAVRCDGCVAMSASIRWE